MMEGDEGFGTFLENLLKEDEQNDKKLELVHIDMMLMEVKNLIREIANNFNQSDKEKKIIDAWVLHKNSKLQNRVDYLEKQLETFIKDSGEKTIDLPNGVLKYHKKQDKVEITDMALFLKNAKPELFTIIPEQIKPDLTNIKSYIKTHFTPKGISIIEGQQEFSYKIKEQESENARENKTRDRFEQAAEYRIAL